MSKDKSHKKGKSKKHDLFSMMLEQSEVFREMVMHFQNVWIPRKPPGKSDEAASPSPETAIAKKPARTARSAKNKTASATRKAKAAPAAKKPAAATRKDSGKKAPAAKSSKPVASVKVAGKTARRPARKSSPKK
jgi:hypothetical protein